MKLQEKKPTGTELRCALVASDGRYRIESRLQKSGRNNVENRIARGQLTASELGSLRKILDTPALAGLQHHKPPDSVPLTIMGSVLDLSINRANGVQDLIFTDERLRTTFFYSGDADIGRASQLLHLVWQQIEPGASGLNSTADLNGCSELP
jgi:hypothetical protein